MAVFEAVESIQALVIGANRGIGLGFVQHLLQQPQVGQVFATHRQAVTSELQALAQATHRLQLVPMDITAEAEITAGIAQIQQQTDRLHLVLYCVGLLHDGALQPEKSLQQIQADYLLQYFQINSIGAVLVAKHLLPLLKHRDPSVYAAISAKVGSIGDNQLGGWYGYRASKAALNMLLHTTAIEYSRKSPRTIVALLHPGTTDTQLSQPFQRNVPPEKLFPVTRTVAQLMKVIESLELADSGQFFSWDGSTLPW
jgi:NAD(P)-dependent dehydrogenase (short-subunit alcohol dehydrogenase family)